MSEIEKVFKVSTLNLNLSFDDAIEDVRSLHNRKLKKGTHNYWVLYAMFRGDVIDDYNNKPLDADGKPIYNIKSRISDLTNKFGLRIERDVHSKKHYMKYWIER